MVCVYFKCQALIMNDKYRESFHSCSIRAGSSPLSRNAYLDLFIFRYIKYHFNDMSYIN